jgi:hypothetical protein
LQYRVESLERFRKEYRPKVDDLMTEATLEKAVKAALDSQRHALFTIPQKLGGLVVVTLAVASFVLQVAHG